MLKQKYRINNKQSLDYFLECDKKALHINARRPSIVPFKHRIWKFERLLRKTEYWSNQEDGLSKLIFRLYYLRYKLKCLKANVEVPINCIREGLVIWHLNGIIINSNSVIGKNFSISAFCVVGENKGKNSSIGDNVEIMLGSKVLGVNVADNNVIGASALVIKDIVTKNGVYAGIPAKYISGNYKQVKF